MELLKNNLLSPLILSFALGVIARLVKSDLKFHEALSTTLSLFLLMAIGLKGGSAAAKSHDGLLLVATGALLLACLIPVWSFFIAKKIGKYNNSDSASLAAHFGSTSAVTFLACLAFLDQAKQSAEGFMPAILALMEIPAIAIALLIARIYTHDKTTGKVSILNALGNVLASKSILLLLGGFAIGFASPNGLKDVSAFFVDPFKGVLCLFLLELGMSAAEKLKEIRSMNLGFLIIFATLLPLCHGLLGVMIGKWTGLSLGGSVALATLAAGASYIAAPAAVKMGIPTANTAIGVGAALGITFPFNLAIGLPTYFMFAKAIYG